jgi:hypothetical protein
MVLTARLISRPLATAETVIAVARDLVRAAPALSFHFSLSSAFVRQGVTVAVAEPLLTALAAKRSRIGSDHQLDPSL